MRRATQIEKARAGREIADLEAVHRGRHLIVLLLTLCGFALSSWMTAKGLFDRSIESGTATVPGMVTALMSATVAATLVGGATMLLIGIAMDARKLQRWAVAGLALALTPFTLCISIFYSVLGNAGAPSLVYDMRGKAVEFARYYERSSTDTSGAQSAQAALRPLQASICGLARGEKKSGLLTGSAGAGAVSAAYASSCLSVNVITETLSETVARTQGRRDDASEILANLSAIPKDTNISVFERQSAFRAEAGKLRKLIEESSAEKVAERLRAQLKILHASVAALDVQAGAFGEKQRSAVESLRTSLGLVTDTISDLLDDGETLPVQRPAELLEMGAAVTSYWSRNLPPILLAILVDLIPLWFVGFLLVSRATVQTRKQELLDGFVRPKSVRPIKPKTQSKKKA